MPRLGHQKLVELTLPSSTKEDPAKITASRIISSAVAIELQGKKAEEQVFIVLADCIKEWNFTNENGDKAEITAKNVSLLDSVDILYLREKINFDEHFNKSLSKLKKKGLLRISIDKQKEQEAKGSQQQKSQ